MLPWGTLDVAGDETPSRDIYWDRSGRAPSDAISAKLNE